MIERGVCVFEVGVELGDRVGNRGRGPAASSARESVQGSSDERNPFPGRTVVFCTQNVAGVQRNDLLEAVWGSLREIRKQNIMCFFLFVCFIFM